VAEQESIGLAVAVQVDIELLQVLELLKQDILLQLVVLERLELHIIVEHQELIQFLVLLHQQAAAVVVQEIVMQQKKLGVLVVQVVAVVVKAQGKLSLIMG
jgi:hypothetical protein